MTHATDATPEPVVLINVFTAKPGRLDEFVALQSAELARLSEEAPPAGWRGSRLHRAVGGSNAIMVTVFDSIEHHRQWIETGDFAEHVEAVMPLLEDARPAYYEIVGETGRL